MTLQDSFVDLQKIIKDFENTLKENGLLDIESEVSIRNSDVYQDKSTGLKRIFAKITFNSISLSDN